MTGGFEVVGITAGEVRLWCAAAGLGLRERRARENELRRLWASGDSRPEWCLLAREGMVPLGALLLLKEDREGHTLLVDGLSLPWKGAWRGLGRRMLTAAMDTARRSGALALAWHLPLELKPDPAPLALEMGFVEDGHRSRSLLELAAAPPAAPGVRTGWHTELEPRLEDLPAGQQEFWREGGDLLLSAGTGRNALLALCDGEGFATLLGPAAENPEAAGIFGQLLAGLWRYGVRRIELETAGAEAPDWFVSEGSAPAQRLSVIRCTRWVL